MFSNLWYFLLLSLLQSCFTLNAFCSNNDSAVMCLCVWKLTSFCRNKVHDKTKIWIILIFSLFSIYGSITLSASFAIEMLLKFYCSYFVFWMTPFYSSVPVPSLAHSFLESTSFYTYVIFNNSFSFKVFSSFVFFLLSFLFKWLTPGDPKFWTILSSLLLIVHAIVVSMLIILVIDVFFVFSCN